jgi:hypothetical protein
MCQIRLTGRTHRSCRWGPDGRTDPVSDATQTGVLEELVQVDIDPEADSPTDPDRRTGSLVTIQTHGGIDLGEPTEREIRDHS